MKKLYLLRHAQAQSNVLNLVNGTLGHRLTVKGRAQAHELRQFLERYAFNFDHHWVSPWNRARETAEILLPDKEFLIDSRLGEHDAGLCGNLTWSEAEEQYGKIVTEMGFHDPYPGGESRSQLFARIVAWFLEMDRYTEEDASILAVTHAGPIDCLLQYVCGIPPESRKSVFYAQNASLTCVVKEPGGRWTGDTGGWEMKFFSVCNTY